MKLTGKEVREIVKEYTPSFEDTLTADERTYLIKEALSKQDPSDRIIFAIWLYSGSERKTADLLGVSRTPVNTVIRRVKDKIRLYIENYENNHKTDREYK